MQKAGDYVGAIETYKAALTIDPKGVDALSNLGAAYVHLGQFEDAIAQYKTALEIRPRQRDGADEPRARLLQVRSPERSSRPAEELSSRRLPTLRTRI